MGKCSASCASSVPLPSLLRVLSCPQWLQPATVFKIFQKEEKQHEVWAVHQMKVLSVELAKWSFLLTYPLAAMDRTGQRANCAQHCCCLEIKPLGWIKNYFLNVLPIFQYSEIAWRMIVLGHVAVMLKMENGCWIFALECRSIDYGQRYSVPCEEISSVFLQN